MLVRVVLCDSESAYSLSLSLGLSACGSTLCICPYVTALVVRLGVPTTRSLDSPCSGDGLSLSKRERENVERASERERERERQREKTKGVDGERRESDRMQIDRGERIIGSDGTKSGDSDNSDETR